ncbi:LITTLE NINJA, ABI five binding protein 2 [Hibiscus trionum]|uniref:Ninja-family protein n=1 Tax=Hibiscus trionum TaxID=183268 RepID=A0A9W7IZV7_HIBTR|nr:LITTLE NINJA, ABI five binding protein 2 [Hibiscus trionum]
MAEPKESQDMNGQINFLFQEKQQLIQFFPSFSFEKRVSEQDSNPEPDLTLRLSLGGIYGTGTGSYTEQNPLTRSSTITGQVVGLKTNLVELAENTMPEGYDLSLDRSCSLPVIVESSKRVMPVNVKESRMMRRAEAKRRAEEKQRNAMKAADRERLPMPPPPPPRSPPAEFPAWAVASAARNPALLRAIAKIKEFRNSQGSSSNLMKSGPVITSDAVATGNFVKRAPEKIESENPTKKAKLPNGRIQDDGMAIMKQMPSVTTTGDGPNGRKIEGILYKYNKEQVHIVCVCHGKFLSPEEFVMHAGGTDVANPMKHITVCSTSY